MKDIKWKTTLFVTAVTISLYAPCFLSTDIDPLFFAILFLCPVSAIGSLTLFAAAISLRGSKVAATLMVNGVTIALVPLTMFLLPTSAKEYAIGFEDRVCWFLFSKEYKAALRSQTPAWNELSHIHWRSWGALDRGQSWLVFDPSGRLGESKTPDGFVPNIPCPVYNMEILSKQYVVVDGAFEALWNYCPDAVRH